MQILLIKTSSLGDVFHTLPALTDAHRAIPGLRVDWVVEEAFAQIPTWHPAVAKVIPLAWRRWRKQLTKARTWGEMRGFYGALTAKPYDLVLDAQGLLKSALVTRLARGPRCGLSRRSAREPLASLAYDRPLDIAKGQHAIHRLRQLFAACLGYDASQHELDYGIDKQRWPAPASNRPYVVFLHGSTWDTKLWPETYWRQLRDLAITDGYDVVLPWGNAEERQRAMRLAADSPQARVFDKAPLEEVARLLAHASAVVGVDTGLSHVAAALAIPTVAIYGATDPRLTGILGPRTTVLQSGFACAPCLKKHCPLKGQDPAIPFEPCYQELAPSLVWGEIQSALCNAPLANLLEQHGN